VSGTSIARGALVVAALASIVVLVAFHRSEDGCTDSVKAMFFALKDRAPDPALDATLDRVEDDCDGSGRLVDSGAVLLDEGRRAQAARLFDEAAEREPESFSAWAGLRLALDPGDPAAAEAAARAAQLNPYYRPPS
jgi:hypothetical protein